ncbi:MAG: carboxymuconolactone decarboxylase family protein [Chitinophagaceae bacterium]|nr:MAG: carboxymuconolactone decarboxylase family protein [Chitinophagaceae bacterium]
MAFIDLQNDFPGIRGPMAYRPETAGPMNQLANVLLHDEDHTLSRGERELIGAYVSSLNNCFFCQQVHGAMAQHYLGCSMQFIDGVKENPEAMDLSGKMKSLLAIAASVQQGGKMVTEAQVTLARENGATDLEIHDTVLIAAAFCMFNRYVDGLQTWAPQDRQVYIGRAAMNAANGYADVTN